MARAVTCLTDRKLFGCRISPEMPEIDCCAEVSNERQNHVIGISRREDMSWQLAIALAYGVKSVSRGGSHVD